MNLASIVDEPLPDIDESNTVELNENKPQRVSGARVTEGNARLLAFAGMFPGADSEAFSVLSNRQETKLSPGGMLPTVKGTEKRLRKLEALGTLGKYKNPLTNQTHYSLTKQGFAAAWSFGYGLKHGATLNGASRERATHYQMIAHVAAQFASPEGFFRESLGIEPVALYDLISEHAMRGSFEPVKEKLKAWKKKGESGDFGRWREAAMIYAIQKMTDKKIHPSDLVESNPALLTIGQPQREGTKLKAVYQPDLAVMLDHDRTDARSKNLLVEVELSKKSWEEYNSILATIARELDHEVIYSRAVYFTVGTQVETLLRKVDRAGGYNLFSTGKLLVLPILHRDRSPVSFSKRITIGGI